MSFQWRNYLDFACYIKDNVENFPDAEACYRTAVSRAYYAAFSLARNYVQQADGKVFYGNDHQALQEYLKKNSHDKQRMKLGNQLKRLHQDRKKSDYDNFLDEKPCNKANKAIILASKIVNTLQQLS